MRGTFSLPAALMRQMNARVLFFASIVIAGCGGATPPSPAPRRDASTPSSDTSASPAPATFAEQVALGQTLYGSNCASCHGGSGEGTSDAPAVVGLDKGALPLAPPPNAKYRKSQFKTVADIADFV